MRAVRGPGPLSGSRDGDSGASWKPRVVLGLVSIVVALGLGELAIRLVVPGGRAGRSTELEEGEVFTTHHPQLGWVLQPGARARQTSAEFDVSIAINGAGMREHSDYSPQAAPGMRRVLSLGDSFTFGHGVAQASAYPELLEVWLEDTEVINLAVTGYGTDQQLLLLRQRGLSYHPDVILVGLFEGNVFRNARRYQLIYPKPRFELAPGELVLTGVPVPRLPDDAAPAERFPLRSLALLGTHARDLWEHLGYGEAWRLTERILGEMRDAAAERGATLFVVVIPKDQAVYGTGWRHRVHQRTLEKIRRLLERNGIAYVDTTPALRAWAREHPSQPLYYPRDGHWTAAGHRVAARALLAPLRRQLASRDGRPGTAVTSRDQAPSLANSAPPR